MRPARWAARGGDASDWSEEVRGSGSIVCAPGFGAVGLLGPSEATKATVRPPPATITTMAQVRAAGSANAARIRARHRPGVARSLAPFRGRSKIDSVLASAGNGAAGDASPVGVTSKMLLGRGGLWVPADIGPHRRRDPRKRPPPQAHKATRHRPRSPDTHRATQRARNPRAPRSPSDPATHRTAERWYVRPAA